MAKNYLGQLGDYEIKQLKIFKTVVDCGGFSAAETELNISRPSISNHIANLESRLNMKLCRRGRAGFFLTEEGAVIYEQVKDLLNQLEHFRNTINNLSSMPTGQLKIAMSDAICMDPRAKMPEILKYFSRNAPEVELIIDVDEMKNMELMVLKNQVDIAVIPYHRRLEGLDYIHLYTDINFLYCGKEHPLFDLADEEIDETTINQQKLVHAGLKPNIEVYDQLSTMRLFSVSYYYETRIAMLLSGFYIGFLPEEIAQPYVDSGELKVIAPNLKSFHLGVAVITKKTAQPNRARELFLTSIRHVLHPYRAKQLEEDDYTSSM